MDTQKQTPTFPTQPLLARENSAVRDFMRERGYDTHPSLAIMDLNSTSGIAAHSASNSTLRRQLEFDGLSPLEIESGLSRLRESLAIRHKLNELTLRLSDIRPGPQVDAEIEVAINAEFRTRNAHWWRYSSWKIGAWAFIASALATILTAVFVSRGSSLTPVAILIGLTSVGFAIAAAIFAWRNSSKFNSEFPEHPPLLWAQSIAALDLQATLEEATTYLASVDSFRGDQELPSALSLDPDQDINAARINLNSEIGNAYWRYRELVELSLMQARIWGDPLIISRAEQEQSNLVSSESTFQPRNEPSQSQPWPDLENTKKSFSVETADSSEQVLVSLWAGVFILALSVGVMGAPSAVVASQACSYADAGVKLDRCEDLRNLSASSIESPNLNLQDRNISGSDFSSANLSGSNFTRTIASYTQFVGANLAGLQADEADFTGTNATDVDLTDSTLTRVAAVGSVLSGAQLNNAKMTESDFSGSLFIGANLTKSNATGVNFSGSDLTGANLSGANLTNADLSGSDLSNVNLEGAVLKDTDFSASILKGLDLSKINLTEVTLNFVDLSGLDLKGLDLSGLSLVGADLSDADLTNASLERSDLLDADLRGADITGLKLAGANLGGVSVKALLDGGADLNGVDLTGADLTGLSGSEISLTNTTLDGVDLSGFDLTGAVFDGSSLIGANLDDAILSGASFVGTNFTDATLIMAEMTDATFTGARFSRSNLQDVRALNSDFIGASFIAANLAGADFSNSKLNQATGLGTNANEAQWQGATCPNGRSDEICRS